MKNFRKILTAFLLVISVFAVTACGAKVENSNGGYKLLKTMEFKIEGVSMEMSYYGEGDKAYRQTTKTEMSYKLIPGGTKEDAEKTLKPIAEKYKEVKGIIHKIEFKEDHLIEELDVDYKELDFEKAKNLPGMMFEGDPKNGVSVQKSVELLEKNGFKEKK